MEFISKHVICVFVLLGLCMDGSRVDCGLVLLGCYELYRRDNIIEMGLMRDMCNECMVHNKDRDNRVISARKL